MLTIGLEKSEEANEDLKAENGSLYIQQKVMVKHRETGIRHGVGTVALPKTGGCADMKGGCEFPLQPLHSEEKK